MRIILNYFYQPAHFNMTMTIKRITLFAIFLATALHFSFANAGEGAFGWIYTLDLQPKGKLEFEQRLQLNNGSNWE